MSRSPEKKPKSYRHMSRNKVVPQIPTSDSFSDSQSDSDSDSGVKIKQDVKPYHREFRNSDLDQNFCSSTPEDTLDREKGRRNRSSKDLSDLDLNHSRHPPPRRRKKDRSPRKGSIEPVSRRSTREISLTDLPENWKRPSRKPSLTEAVEMVRNATLKGTIPTENNEKSLVPAGAPVIHRLEPRVPKRKLEPREKEKPPDSTVYRLQVFDCLTKSLHRGLWYLSQMVANYPYFFILIPFVISALCLVGFIIHKNTLVFEAPFYSFYAHKVPSTSRFYANLAFNSSNPHYDALDKVSSADFAVILKTPKGTSVLREEVMDRYISIRKTMETIKVTSGNKVLKYSTLCRDWQASCEEDVVEKIMMSGSSVSLKYPETLVADEKKNMSRIFLGTTFGGVETDTEGAIARARALAMYFRLRKTSPSTLLHQWDQQFQKELSQMPGGGRNITWWSFGAFLDSVGESFFNVYKGMGYSALITLVLCVLATFATSSYRSKPWAGLGIFVAVALSHLASLAINVGVSGKLNVTSFPVFFTFSATGILVLLSLIQGWAKFSRMAVHPKEKLQFLLSWDGPNIVGSCASGIVAFVVAGASTSIPYFRYILFLNAGSVVFLLLFAVLFFCAVVYLTGKREAAGVKWFTFWQTGDTHFPLPLTIRFNKKDLHRLHQKLADVEPSFSRAVGDALAKVSIRYAAFLIFAIYAIFAIWGCTLVSTRLMEDDFLLKDSEPSHFLNDYREFYGRHARYLELSFNDVVDYMSPEYRDAILDMLDWAQEQQLATRVVSWLRDFMRFEQSSIYLVNRDTFVPVVNLVYLQTDRYKQYTTDIAFDKYQAQIVSSRMYMELSRKGEANHLELINGLLDRANQAGLPLKIQAPSIFLLQHDVQLKPAFVSAFCIIIFIISVGGLVFFAQPFTSLFTIISTLSIAAGTIGYGALWDVPLNAPTVATLMSGLLYSSVVCFNVCFHFSNSGSGKTPRQRMEYTYQSSLWPTLLSSVIPVLAIIPLVMNSCPLAIQVGKLLAIHMLFTVFHFLLFLPPCLLLLVQNLPKCCDTLQEMCDQLCVCCDTEEDATSIYYIPTTGRTLDRNTIQQYFNKHSLRALPPPPLPCPQMLMGPPLDLEPEFEPHSPRVHSSGYGSLPRSYRSRRGSPPPMERDRYFRPRSVSPGFQRGYRVTETPEPRITSPAPSVKPNTFGREEVEKKLPKEEEIYEEPPADSPTPSQSSLASGSIYIVKEGNKGRHREMRRVSSRQAEREMMRDRRSRDLDRAKRWSREYHRPESYHDFDDYDPRVEALRPSWKHYYLDGALRPGPGPDLPPPGRLPPRGGPPYSGLPSDIPDRGIGRARSSYPTGPYRPRDRIVPGPPPPYMGPRPVW